MAESLRDEPGIRESIIDKICELISGDPDAAKGQKGGLRVNEYKHHIENMNDIPEISISDDTEIFVRTAYTQTPDSFDGKDSDFLIIANTASGFEDYETGDILKFVNNELVKNGNILDILGIKRADGRNGFSRIKSFSDFIIDDLDNFAVFTNTDLIYEVIGDKNIAIACEDLPALNSVFIVLGAISHEDDSEKGEIWRYEKPMRDEKPIPDSNPRWVNKGSLSDISGVPDSIAKIVVSVSPPSTEVAGNIYIFSESYGNGNDLDERNGKKGSIWTTDGTSWTRHGNLTEITGIKSTDIIYSGSKERNNPPPTAIDSRILRGGNHFKIKKGDIFISRTADGENKWEHYHEGNPSRYPNSDNPEFQYRCGIKSVSTDPIDPRAIQNPIKNVPALYFGYGGVRRFTDTDIANQDPRFLNEKAVDEEFERLVILLYIIYDKFKNDKNVITTSARIHDMIGMFVDKLRQSPPELGEIANIEDARLAFASPSSASPDGVGQRRELLFSIEIDYTYLMGH